MALTADIQRQIAGGYEIENVYLVMAPSVTIYKGAALTIDGGRVRPLTAGKGKRFIGFAHAGKTTTAGQTWERVHVYLRGMVDLTVAGATLAHIGGDVWATDDNTFTVDGTGTPQPVHIGKLITGANGAWHVLFDAFSIRPH